MAAQHKWIDGRIIIKMYTYNNGNTCSPQTLRRRHAVRHEQ